MGWAGHRCDNAASSRERGWASGTDPMAISLIKTLCLFLSLKALLFAF